MKISRRNKASTDTEKATLEIEEAKHYAKEACLAEEAKVILLKTKKDSEEAIDKFKLEAEKAMAILLSIKELL